MATILYKQTGNTNFSTAQAETLGELKQALNLNNYLATVKHGPSTSTQSLPEFKLEDGMTIVFSEQTKGA